MPRKSRHKIGMMWEQHQRANRVIFSSFLMFLMKEGRRTRCIMDGGIDAHEQEAIAVCEMSPDPHLLNNPYKIRLGGRRVDLHGCRFCGIMKGPITMPDGAVIQPTKKSFHLDCCIVVR